VIENSRKKIAHLLNASPSEIFFTSGGTESNNTAISGCVEDLGVTHIITSPIEHHAVLHTVENLEKRKKLSLSMVKINHRGEINLKHFEELLQKDGPALVTLMYANNEIANLNPIKEIGELSRQYNAYFHSDMVQATG